MDEEEEKRDSRLINHFGQSWFDILHTALHHEYYLKMSARINKSRKDGEIIYPASRDTFRAFRLTPFDKVKVVFMGLDPYATEIASGLSFDCQNSPDISPSWRKILEVYMDHNPGYFGKLLGGDLSGWAKEGVFMLNAALTVPRGNSGAHLQLWKPFTRTVIKKLVKRDKPPLFIMIGKDAASLCEGHGIADTGKIQVEHPAFAHRQNRIWDASSIFTDINEYLSKHDETVIDWTA